MDQNVGLVMFRLPIHGEGFKLRVNVDEHRQPKHRNRLRTEFRRNAVHLPILHDPSLVWTCCSLVTSLVVNKSYTVSGQRVGRS